MAVTPVRSGYLDLEARVAFRLTDSMLPNGRISVAAGERINIPRALYLKYLRFLGPRVTNLEAPTAAAPAAADRDPDPPHTHLYKGTPAHVVGAQGEGETERVTVAVEGRTAPLVMKRSTWEGNAEALPPAPEREQAPAQQGAGGGAGGDAAAGEKPPE